MGELSKVLDLSSVEIINSFPNSIADLNDFNGTLVAKYPSSIIVNDNGYINSTGNSGLATAGSGDVLSGLIAGLAARKKISMFHSCLIAVAVHGHAADMIVKHSSKIFNCKRSIGCHSKGYGTL